ncbi:hypothetical protein B0T19DRAFT_401316 [Cercophora scortea]|uniref:Uncharacterized protein n=1 Tax=Cercophora scortea TaxID=314031 RepID=A0AAE0IP06_9PEZI|nr:hypothetical protein B0T19DRAFT_401316 [Cercophora scortea]
MAEIDPVAALEKAQNLVDLPGARDYFHDKPPNNLEEVLHVVQRLAAANVPSCLVGVGALRYYGAARASNEWDVCVPDDKLESARCLFDASAVQEGHQTSGDVKSSNGTNLEADNESAALDPKRIYEVAKPPPSIDGSLRHTYPCFHLQGFSFYFVLVPSSGSLIDPSSPEGIELTKKGVPYPKITPMARSLIIQGQWSDLCDLIDGVNLDVDWGLENFNFDELLAESVELAHKRNEVLARLGHQGRMHVQDLERRWRLEASDEAKEKRIDEIKKGRYVTKWRPKKSPQDDPVKRYNRDKI